VGANGAKTRPLSSGGAFRNGAFRSRVARAARALALVALACCTKATPVPRDDEPKIRAILDADEKVDRALREADEADPARGADVIDTKATPAADEAIAIANAQSPVTDWGKSQKEALLGLLRDRRSAMPEYAKSLRTGDLDVKLAALEKQRDLEKRAMEVTARARNTPP